MIAEPRGCVPPEDLAALAEGRLQGRARDEVVSHLAGCAECREVFAGTVEVLEEVEAGDARPESSRPREAEGPGAEGGGAAGPSTVMPFDRAARKAGRRWTILLGALAATLALASAVVVYQRLATPSPPSRQEWLAAMPPAEELVPHIWGGVTMRGGEEAHGELARQSAELGALLVDVEVAVGARDTERAADLLYRMAAILDDAGLMQPEVTALRSTASMDTGELSAAASRVLPQVESRLRQRFLPLYLDLGIYLEQVRLAELTGSTDFREGRGSRRYVDWVLGQDESALPSTVRRDLEILQDRSASTTAHADVATRALRILVE
jgi:hypothetical protein